VRKNAPEIQYLKTPIDEQQRREFCHSSRLRPVKMGNTEFRRQPAPAVTNAVVRSSCAHRFHAKGTTIVADPMDLDSSFCSSCFPRDCKNHLEQMDCPLRNVGRDWNACRFSSLNPTPEIIR
jgi:hypothetical protein